MDRIVSGHDTCLGLSDRGREQAQRLRDRLLDTKELGQVDAVFTSILQRSIETAEVLRPALGDLAPQADCGWCELHPGEAEGLVWPDVEKQFPPDADPQHPFTRRVPGMETWAEFYARVGSELERIGREHGGQSLVVVGHGGTIGASFVALGDLPPRHGIDLIHGAVNTSLTEWRREDGRWRLVRYNDAAHLAGTGLG